MAQSLRSYEGQYSEIDKTYVHFVLAMKAVNYPTQNT